MHIKVSTDYAIRCLLFLAENKKGASTKEIADAVLVSREFTQKTLRRLRLSGLVETTRGVNGGYKLAKPTDEITLLDIMSVMEETMVLDSTHQTADMATRRIEQTKGVYNELQNQIHSYLGSITIASLGEADIA